MSEPDRCRDYGNTKTTQHALKVPESSKLFWNWKWNYIEEEEGEEEQLQEEEEQQQQQQQKQQQQHQQKKKKKKKKRRHATLVHTTACTASEDKLHEYNLS